MRIRSLLIVLLSCLIATITYAQVEERDINNVLTPLTPDEELQLQALPELKLPPGYENQDLPYMVDNSTQPCMRPAFQQAGLCCGQASCIGYNFTYEMSRERGLDASLLENQYPTHFSWNFMNGGEGWYGVSYLHSIQILKEFGMPNAVDYGGSLSYGGPSRWMSGYTEYFNGMHNRITNAYQIQAGTPEGLQVVKNWLYDHLEGSPVGGVCSFYAQYMSATNTLPEGTPEAGKYVLTYFGGSANHAMTIIGYNDSIRWDYNGDGQYTNDIDINDDGVVNMKDWEIGGFKMVQSYGGVPNWGDQGYAYMMYKTIADNLGGGGIWNHCVHVLDVKETYNPKLTARILLNHSRREMIKVLAGISNNVNSSRPEVQLGFPIYDYQGGYHYMQGGSTEADKTIEFGLDLSRLLSYVNPGQNAKIFLQVVEKDPGDEYAGQVIHFGIYDLTSGGGEISCEQTYMPLVNNDTTTLSVTHTFNFNRVAIFDEALPPAPEGEFYSYQLTAVGGTQPYIWDFDKTYGENDQTGTFPAITTTQLTPSNSTSGYVTHAIDFAFPFYDSSYTSITVHVDGYLMFNQELYPFPYYDDDKVLFNITRHISPYLNRHQEINGGQGCGIWYEGDEQSATFRWKTSLTEDPTMVTNYAVRLFPDGTIKFFYGSMDGCDEYTWVAGIGDGDGFNHQEIHISNKPDVAANTCITLDPYHYPPEMHLSEDGIFSGTPEQSYGNEQITFKVTDNNFIFSKKTLIFSSTGIIIQDSVVSGDDNIIGYGETTWMNISVLNARQDTVPNAVMNIHISDPYITVADSTETLGTLIPGETKTFANAFHFSVSDTVPNGHLITIMTEVTSDTATYESNMFHYAYAPIVTTGQTTVEDDNGRLDAGDTTDISIPLVNSGGVGITGLYAELSTDDPYITINQDLINIPLIESGQSADAIFNLSVSGDCPPGHTVDFLLGLAGDGNYMTSDSIYLVVGLYLEDFETGNFSLFSWGNDGNRPWKIDTYSPFEGVYCARSGIITHNEESVLMTDLEVLSAGDISFYVRTSCENDTSQANNYDYLAFRIDGNEMGRWDGLTAWSKQSFPVTAGFHRFEWVYHKDNSVNYRYDAAWVDLIAFPSANKQSPSLEVNPTGIDLIMKPGESGNIALVLSNPAQGDLQFTADIAGIEPFPLTIPAGGRNIEGSNMVCNTEKFHSGTVNIWNLKVYNGGSDNEWIKQIYITFPQDFNLTTATDFNGGSGGSMVFQGPFGNGVTAHWFGEDANGWGVVHMGELASSDVTVEVSDTITRNIFLDCEIDGEVYGGTPHTVYCNLYMRNLGPLTHWLSIDTTAGILPGNTTDSLILTVNTEGMEDGKYEAWVLLQDNFNNEIIIPVNLTLDTYLGYGNSIKANDENTIIIQPNPFRDKTLIEYNAGTTDQVNLVIYNSQGLPVRSENVKPDIGGNVIYAWNGCDNNGNLLPSGVYVIRIVAGTHSVSAKTVITR